MWTQESYGELRVVSLQKHDRSTPDAFAPNKQVNVAWDTSGTYDAERLRAGDDVLLHEVKQLSVGSWGTRLGCCAA
ncbi:MAG TPA: hypothetical protein VES20_11945 [Bryobacteraceae bacterium]|nr:hypothetical protein [Bryobacteraceae bacterium]